MKHLDTILTFQLPGRSIGGVIGTAMRQDRMSTWISFRHRQQLVSKMLNRTALGLFVIVISTTACFAQGRLQISVAAVSKQSIQAGLVTNQRDPLFLLSDGDAVSAGSDVVVTLHSEVAGKVSLEFRLPTGLARTLDVQLDADRNTRIIDSTGKTLSITEIGKHEIRLSSVNGEANFSFSSVDGSSLLVDTKGKDTSSELPVEADRGALAVAGAADQYVIETLEFSRSLATLKPELPQSATRSGAGAQVFRQASPSVVLILASKGAIGSGAIISERGQILTNHHVVGEDRTVGVVLKPSSGEQIKPTDVISATVIRVDEVADLAVLQLSKVPTNLPALKIGDEKTLEVGGVVHAIGHPSGEYWTYTQGVVSQIRDGYIWQSGEDKVQHRANVIQTQTPINPGNSGGPLLNDQGMIVGVNSFVNASRPGLNYAVAASSVKQFLSSNASRRAETPRAAAVAGDKPNPNCKPTKFEPFQNKNGKTIRPIDTQCKGWPNLYLVGENSDGSPEVILIDRVGDQKFDVRIVTNVEGKYDLWIFLANRDGVPTSYGYDYERKGKIDRTVVVASAFR